MKPLHRCTDTEFERLAGQAARLPEVPASLLRAAVALWARRPAAHGVRARVERARRCVMAVLSFDSAGTSGLALGMRGAAATVRHRVCSAPGCDIDLRVAPAAGRFDISGQMLGRDGPARLLMTAIDGDPSEGCAALDALGEFRLPGLAGGRYRLVLRTEHEDILLPEIELGGGSAA